MAKATDTRQLTIQHMDGPPLLPVDPPAAGDIVPEEVYPPDRHPVMAYIVRLSTPASRDSMTYRLKQAAQLLSGGRYDAFTLPWHRLTYVHVLALRTKLVELRKAPQTCNATLYAVKGVLKQCRKLSYMTADQHILACDIETVKGFRLPKGRSLAQEELETLFRSCATDERRTVGAHDAGLIAVLYGLGLRRVEAVTLEVCDYSPSKGEVRVRHGKGNKERLVYTNAASAQALNDWLTVRRDWPGPLFPEIGRWGHIQPNPLTTRGLGAVLKQRAQRAGVAPFTDHDLRRTFISTLLDRAVDLPTVQQLAGHINIQTTALYDRRGERAKQAAMPLLPVPYLPPTA